MEAISAARLIDTVKRHEGYRSKAYKCTAGKWTIGFGRNIEDVGITRDEAERLLIADLTKAKRAAAGLLTNWYALDGPRQEALINMTFNLGPAGVRKFKKMLAAIEAQDWPEAAAQALDSKWARQVKSRAQEIAAVLEHGQWPE